jgi:hypothetical protein
MNSTASYKTKSRRLQMWSDVNKADQPAIFQIQKHEIAKTTTNQPTTWTLKVDIYIYANSSDKAIAPSTILNPLLDAITAALAPQGENQTLGGLVQYCRISGAIETDEGVLGDQSVAIIPLEILTI